MYTSTVGYDEIAQKLSQAFGVCAALGLDARKSRFGDYARRIDRLIAVIKAQRAGQSVETAEQTMAADGVAYMLALTEATEFGEVVDALKDGDRGALSTKLGDVLAGPLLPIDEDASKGNRSRNVLFELNLAAELRRGGLVPQLGEHPDVYVEVGGRRICFECKRPFTRQRIATRLQEAERQLIRDLNEAGHPPSARGIVAISVSKALNPGELLYRYRDAATAERRLAEELTELMQRHAAVYRKFRDRILGVIFHVITPGEDTTRGRYDVAQEMVVKDLTIRGSLDRRLIRAFGEALGAEAS